MISSPKKPLGFLRSALAKLAHALRLTPPVAPAPTPSPSAATARSPDEWEMARITERTLSEAGDEMVRRAKARKAAEAAPGRSPDYSEMDRMTSESMVEGARELLELKRRKAKAAEAASARSPTQKPPTELGYSPLGALALARGLQRSVTKEQDPELLAAAQKLEKVALAKIKEQKARTLPPHPTMQ
jgi:hypothetical protein